MNSEERYRVTSEPNLETLGRRLAKVCALLIGGIALLVLGSWVAGRWQMGTLGSDFIPMAPSTALLFLLLGAAVFIRAQGAEGRTGAWFCLVAAGVALAAGALFLARDLLGFELPLEQWLASSDATLKGVPVGRMSPMTALAFVLTSGALLLRSPALADRAAARYLARVLTLGVSLGAVTVLISYSSGEPLFYGQGLVPMALPTAIAFMLLGASLLALSTRKPSPGLRSPPRLTGWWPMTILAVLAGAVALTGWFYLRAQLVETRGQVEAELNAIADLKVQQIVTWRQERLADAAVIGQAAFFARDVQTFFNDSSPTAKAELIHWLTLFAENHEYRRVSLFDARGELRLTLPDDGIRPGPVMNSHVSDVLRDPRVQMTDLHRGDSGGDIRICLAIPIFAPDSSTIDTRPSSPFAVILLEVDPQRFLYPLIQTWPTPSRTAETLLVRRDGDDALYLNELRHQENTALSLRVPLTRTELPAVRGALGQIGMFETVDYRGVPVLTTVRSVPGTPWFMASKVDQEEVYAPMRERAWSAGLVGAMLVLAALLGIGLLWRQQRLESSRRELAERAHAEAVVRESEEQLRRAQEIAHLGSWQLDLVHNRLSWSDEVYRIFGLIPQEFGATYEAFLERVHPDDRQKVDEAYGSSLRENRDTYEIEHRVIRKDTGTVRVVHERCEHSRDATGKITRSIGIVHDITERERAEQINVARLRLIQFAATHNLDELLEATLNEAEALTGSLVGFYHFVEPDQRTLWLQNWSTRTKAEFCKAEGKGLHYDIAVAGVWTDCVHQRRPVIHNDYASLPHRKGLPPGHAPVVRELVVPVMRDEKVVAILGVGNCPENYTDEDSKAVSLLADLAWEIAVRKRAEEEICQLNAELEQRIRDRTAQLEAANHELEAFSYSVAHDLRAPLRAIDGYDRILVKDYEDRLDDEGRRVLGVISRETQRMGALIDDLLAFSRSSRQPMRLTEVDLNALAQAEYERCAAQEPDRLIEFKLHPLPPVQADAAMLRQVLANLLSNALKFTRSREVAVIEDGGVGSGGGGGMGVAPDGAGPQGERPLGLFRPGTRGGGG
ncbi:MAG: PAS domain S-box protein, partial [Actinobacteria bacterium]